MTTQVEIGEWSRRRVQRFGWGKKGKGTFARYRVSRFIVREIWQPSAGARSRRPACVSKSSPTPTAPKRLPPYSKFQKRVGSLFDLLSSSAVRAASCLILAIQSQSLCRRPPSLGPCLCDWLRRRYGSPLDLHIPYRCCHSSLAVFLAFTTTCSCSHA